MICDLVSCTRSRAGPPWGTNLAKVRCLFLSFTVLRSHWPHLGPTFRLFEPPERMMFWHRSKRPKITESMAKGRLGSDILIDFSLFLEPFRHRCFNFSEHRFCIEISMITYMIFKLLNSIKSRCYCRRVAKVKVLHV